MQKLGPLGEKVGAKYLKRLGYRILQRNYRCSIGEIDLIAADGDTLVFVEVKTRSNSTAADPEAAVNFYKRRKITGVAKTFIAQMRAENLPARFDVLSIIISDQPRSRPEIEHFVDAFAPV